MGDRNGARPGLSVSGRRWLMAPTDPARGRELASALGVSPAVGMILAARGISAADEARAFLFGGRETLRDPLLLPGLEAAVRHLRAALDEERKIWVYGDYDVDGVAATALLCRVLEKLGARVEAYIPSRFDEGYGLNKAALEEAAAAGVHTVVTVDCGVTALEEAAHARELGLQLVITDHHEPKERIPAAEAVVDAKLAGSAYPFAGLSGTGVAFKLALALAGPERADLVWEEADLVALATVADMVPLVDENRVLVREGLARMNASEARLGLTALARVAGIKPGQISESHLAFALGPRINALGRLGSAREALQLLLTGSPDEAETLAQHLDAENRRRQAVEAEVLKQAVEQATEQRDRGDRVLVLAAEGWHVGILGLVASRIMDRFRRPTVMLSLEGGEARGSGRSLPAFHLFHALERCEDLLTRFGGHGQAAGLALSADRLPDLKRRLEEMARQELTEDDLLPVLRLDGEVAPQDVTEDLARQLALLAPFGLGNPQPLLALRDVKVAEARRVGRDGSHLKLRFLAGRRPLDGIAFGLAEPAEAGGVAVGHPVDLAALPELNEWNGRVRVQLMVRDLGLPLTAERERPAPAQAQPAAAQAQPGGAPPRSAPPSLVPGMHPLWKQAVPMLAQASEGPLWEAEDDPPAVPLPLPGLDWRGRDTVPALLELASRGLPAVLVAPTLERGLALAAACAQRQPHLAASFVPYHGRFPSALRALVLAEFDEGNAPLLVTAWGGLQGLEPGMAETVLLAGPPLSAAGHMEALALAAEEDGLLWHWDQEAARLTESLVQAFCPGRQELAAFYLHLKAMVQKGYAITADAAAQSGLPAATVKAGLQVFCELGLLSPPDAQAAWAWLPAGKERLALDASPTFRRNEARKQEFQRVAGYFSKVAAASGGAQSRLG
ncbi:MAG: single-stranded-DNA-specific exonuclease RecJ [Bacillota bacterium]